jgi:hypothetical protein
MRVLLILIVIIALNVSAECVHEVKVSGAQIQNIKSQATQAFVQIDGKFIEVNQAKNLKSDQVYTVQYAESFKNETKSTQGYDDTYLKYYDYARINQFLSSNQAKFAQFGYKVEVIGQSVEGRNLFGVFPKEVSNAKKSMIMFGRHHGDEGTANWIIEGFVNKLFKTENSEWFNENQIFLYPMVNPDGAEAHTRYNKNGRDLNRSWAKNVSDEFDEIIHIHNHIRKHWGVIYPKLFIALDMHGSFTEDFIYRVGKSFRDRAFFDRQQSFISELSAFDPWQAGNFKVSSGAPTMSRIVMVKHYGVNALTHETPRDVKINNSRGRSIRSLEEQGEAVFTSILNLYR